MKQIFVKELRSLPKGTLIHDEFALEDVKELQAKDGRPYLSLVLRDRTERVKAIFFGCSAHVIGQMTQSRYAEIRGVLDDFGGGQVKINSLVRAFDQPDKVEDFERVAAMPLPALRQRLDMHIESIKNSHLSKLLKAIFYDERIRGKFEEAPAAKTFHHAYRHGLLQHTLEVTDLAAAVADTQSTWGYDHIIERDLVVAGSLLHDIGKIFEMTMVDGVTNYTSRGEMLGHVTIGMQFVTKKIGKMPGFPQLLHDSVLHIILSHHGRPEFGAPIPPMFAEAQIVHMVDQLDVQVLYMGEAVASADSEFAKDWRLDNRRVFVRSEALAPPDMADTPPTERFMTVSETAPEFSMPDHGDDGRIPALHFKLPSDSAAITFQTKRLPLLGRVAAGPPIDAHEAVEEYFDVDATGLPNGDDLYLLRVRGDSMTGDGIHDGDIVAVRPQEAHNAGDIVVALLRDEDEAAIKRIDMRGDHVLLLSSNPHFPPIIVADPAALSVRGKVIARLAAS